MSFPLADLCFWVLATVVSINARNVRVRRNSEPFKADTCGGERDTTLPFRDFARCSRDHHIDVLLSLSSYIPLLIPPYVQQQSPYDMYDQTRTMASIRTPSGTSRAEAKLTAVRRQSSIG